MRELAAGPAAALRPAGPLPDVPALVLRARGHPHPALGRARVAAAFPRGQLVVAQHSGHSVATSEGSECATAALRRFLAGKLAAACRPTRIIDPVGVPPLKPSVGRAHFGPKVDRTLSAIIDTLSEAFTEALFSDGSIGGLRGGSLQIGQDSIRFVHYSVLPGYALSGFFGPTGTVVLRVTGARAARGFLRIPRRGAVTGRLGDRRISIKLGNLARGSVLARTAGLRRPHLGPRIP